MKMKITRYFAMLAAVAGLSVACQEELEHVVYNPENVVAPVLHAVEDIVVTVDNKSDNVTFTWDAADFGVKTQVYYTLDMARGDKKVSLFSGVSGTSMNVSYDNINNKAFNDLAIPSGDAADVTFTLGASLGVGETFYASPVSAKVTPTAAEKVYPKLTVAGSYAYNSWSPGKGQYVYDFDETDVKYSGVIDFGEDVSALEFKFVGTAWGENEFSAPEGAEQTAEASELTLVAGGGSNISAYRTHRFYSLTLDKSTPKVIKNFSFNQIGVIGSFNGWADDVVMQFNAEKQRFYADVEFTEAGQFKLRADADWSVNWGADAFGVTVSNGDGNLEAAAGQYRIYANMNNPAGMTIELVEGMYGKDEPVGGTTEPEPEPEPVKGWGLVGEYNGWGATPDVMLASDGTYLAAKGVELSGQVKFRKDGGWDVNFGAPGDVEPVEITVNTELTLAANGKNFTIAAGTYDVYLDEANAKAWFINDGSYPGGGAAPEASEWGVVGQVNGWAAPDITMYKTATEGLFVAYNVAMPDGGFKIRANGEWNDAANYGLEGGKGNVEVDHAYDVITSGGSGDMVLVAGNYDIWFDLTNTKVYIMTPGKPISEAEGGEAVTPEPEPEPEVQDWFLVGNFNGWTVADADYKMTKEGDWYVFKGFVSDGQGFKFNAGNWDVNRGATGSVEPFEVTVGTAVEVVNNGKNLAVAAGTYDVYMNAATDQIFVMASGEAPEVEEPETLWYLVGNFNGWTVADTDYKMTKEGDWYVFKGFVSDGQGFKFNAGNWDVNRGATGSVEPFEVTVGTAVEVVNNGKNLAVAAGTYDVYMNAATDKIFVMETGKTPAN